MWDGGMEKKTGEKRKGRAEPVSISKGNNRKEDRQEVRENKLVQRKQEEETGRPGEQVQVQPPSIEEEERPAT